MTGADVPGRADRAENPGVRSLALQTLQSVKADGTVRMALQFLADKDKDQAIRRQSRAMLASMPDMN